VLHADRERRPDPRRNVRWLAPLLLRFRGLDAPCG
jgi:hypothetical protein